MKSPENKKYWIIDPEAAEVVKRIFQLCIDGNGNETIAGILQKDKVLIPMAYWQSKGLNRGGKKTQPNPYKWCKTTVGKILSQQEYCGDVINFKTYSKNFKNKKRIPNDPENWKIFENVHEPIIDRDTFNLVQEHISKGKRRAPKNIRVELSGIETMRQGTEQFTKAIRKFMEMETLSPVLLRELVEKIEVYSAEGQGRRKTQRIIIYYKFIGAIEIPASSSYGRLRKETRQGVEVEYITQSKSA